MLSMSNVLPETNVFKDMLITFKLLACNKNIQMQTQSREIQKNVHSAKGKTVPPPEWHVGCRPWGRKLIAAWCDGWKVAQVSFTHQAPALCKDLRYKYNYKWKYKYGWKVGEVSFTHQAPSLCKITDTNTEEKRPEPLLATTTNTKELLMWVQIQKYFQSLMPWHLLVSLVHMISTES